MIDPAVIFQRTLAGREEIQQKSHGLTQSERLVLIMVDGVATYQEVRNKLPVLTDERFARAMTNLLKKELILEVFLPIESQKPEELERTIIDRFLQQDPLDPVTMIFTDPEEELGLLAEVPSQPHIEKSIAQEEPMTVSASSSVASSTAPAMDDMHNQMADSLGRELRERQLERSAQTQPQIHRPIPIIQQSTASEKNNALLRVHWGYWMIGVGCAFIAGFILAKLIK